MAAWLYPLSVDSMMGDAVMYFARHGETATNKDNRFRGFMNPSLNESGEREAALQATYFRKVPFKYAYISDLNRARETERPRSTRMPWSRSSRKPLGNR